MSEYLCTAGPGDRPFEERHEQFSVAAGRGDVQLSGAFRHGGAAPRRLPATNKLIFVLPIDRQTILPRISFNRSTIWPFPARLRA